MRNVRLSYAAGAAVALAAAGVAVAAYRVFSPRPPRPRPTGVRIAAVGDSITYGIGVNLLRRGRDCYPAQLQRLLGGGYQVLNYGASGRTVQDAGDFPYRRTDLYDASLTVAPAVVVLMLGTNDSKPQNWDASRYRSQLRELVGVYQDLPSRPQILLATPPAAWANSSTIRGEVVADQVVPIVREVAAATRTPVVDVYAATDGHPEWFPDGVHPDRDGAAAIAATVYTGLAQLPIG